MAQHLNVLAEGIVVVAAESPVDPMAFLQVSLDIAKGHTESRQTKMLLSQLCKW